MTRCGIRKALECVTICIALLMSAFVSVSAAGCEFDLSDVQVKKGRIFTVYLECKSDREICAFTAEIEYDANAVEYRSAAVADKSAQYSVNATESGTIRLVYLCEEGADCKDRSPLMELKFKALTSGEYQLSLNARQVIDSGSLDVEVSKAEGATVRVETADAHNNTQREDSVQSEKSDVKSSTKAEESTNSGKNSGDSKRITGVDDVDRDVILIVASVMAVFTLLCMVGFCAYKYGVKATIKKKEQELLTNSAEKKEIDI